MANTINYAEKWMPTLLPTVIDNSYTSMFIAKTTGDATNEVIFDPNSAKTFHFTSMAVGNLKKHVDGKYNTATVTQTDHPYYLDLDIDGRYDIDKKDVIQSNGTASILNVAEKVTKTKATPELDARFFHKVSAACNANSRNEVKTLTAIETAGAIKSVKAAIKKCRIYRANGSLVVFVSTDVMELIEGEMLEKGRTNWASDESLSGGDISVKTKVGVIDGVPIIEIINTDRFNTKFNFDDGFVATGSAINILAVSRQMVKTVPLFQEMKVVAPEDNQLSRGYSLYYSICADTFVFPNGLDGAYDGVWLVKEAKEA